MVMGSMAAAKAAQEAKAAGDEETFAAKMAESNEIRNQAYAKLHHDMQHFVNEASVEQLTQIKEAIAASAARAQQAGIDAIEVHGDRLVGSLCSAILNQRTDEYGGSFENRVRYALEVVAAIKEAAPQLMVEYKLPVIMENPDGTPRGKGGLQPDEACEFAKLLEGAGIDMIQVAQANHTGNMGDTIPPMGAMPYNWTLPWPSASRLWSPCRWQPSAVLSRSRPARRFWKTARPTSSPMAARSCATPTLR